MENYLYYERDDEWVRVDADNYTQQPKVAQTSVIPSSTGQCPTLYQLTIRFEGLGIRGWEEYPRNVSIRAFGPIEGKVTVIPGTYGQQGVRATINSTGESQPTLIVNEPPFGYWDARNFRITARREDGQPDNCDAPAEGCETRFYRDGNLVLTLDNCPAITNGQGCQECCRELLPAMRSLTI